MNQAEFISSALARKCDVLEEVTEYPDMEYDGHFFAVGSDGSLHGHGTENTGYMIFKKPINAFSKTGRKFNRIARPKSGSQK